MTDPTKPVVKQSHPHQFPAGATITWKRGDGKHALTRFGAPTVIVSGDTKEPVTFLGSFDGETFEPIRDAEGDEIRATRPGVYKLPTDVAWLWPTIRGDATVQLFIWK